MLIDLKVYTLVHVVISVLGILTGLVVVGGLIGGNRFPRLIAAFLITSLITVISGFGFPFEGITPAHIVGAISLFTLAGALLAFYGKKLRNAWHRTFVILATTSLYLNVFVLLAQLLQKVPALSELAPAPSAPAFAVTQGLVLMIFVFLGRAALKGSFPNAAA